MLPTVPTKTILSISTVHKSRRDGTAFLTPKNTKIEFASSRIDWSGNAG
jgi:hypothetical protein